MTLARVDGSAVATIGHPTLKGWKLLICQPIDPDGSDIGEPVMAIDAQGAGIGTKVIFSTDGSATRSAVHDDRSPLRNMVVALVDN